MLVRLTDGEAADAEPAEDALSRKYSEVATLFGALDPRLARVMFAKLARAVLDLDSDRRQALLKKTILPGLLDGRLDGAVLKDFPDLELADSLCLLLDLEAAAPEVVTAALTRLELPAERHATMLPLLESRVQTKVGAPPPDSTVDSHARRLLKIDRERAKNVAEFAAFDLSIDDDTRRQLGGVYDADRSGEPGRRAAGLPVEPDTPRAESRGRRSVRRSHSGVRRSSRAQRRRGRRLPSGSRDSATWPTR